jgi:hypothetical protein
MRKRYESALPWGSRDQGLEAIAPRRIFPMMRVMVSVLPIETCEYRKRRGILACRRTQPLINTPVGAITLRSDEPVRHERPCFSTRPATEASGRYVVFQDASRVTASDAASWV